MDLTMKDRLKKKILDCQENVRDFQMFSKKVDDNEVAETFKDFAEQSALQAQKLQELLTRF